MTKLLLRIFVKSYGEVNNPDARNQIGRLASWSGIILNILLVAAKMTAGIISGSVSVLADGLNNLTDATSSVITLIGFKLSNKKADKEHPFGHGRIEYFAGVAVAVLIVVVGIELGRASLDKILKPTAVNYGWVTLAILLISVFLKLWMTVFTSNLGRKIDSAALIAVSADNKNDVIATAAVLIVAIIIRYTGVNLDGFAGLGVAGFIIYNGIIQIKDTANPLLGIAPSDELVRNIIEKIESYDYVLGVHDLIIHDYGPGKQYASAHVELNCDIEPLVSHGVIDEIEKHFLKEENIHLVIHHDPVQR